MEVVDDRVSSLVKPHPKVWMKCGWLSLGQHVIVERRPFAIGIPSSVTIAAVVFHKVCTAC